MQINKNLCSIVTHFYFICTSIKQTNKLNNEKLQSTYFISCNSFFASCSKDDSGSVSGSGVVDDTPVSGKFQKRVLIEDFTGTWCGYCPRVSYGIDRVMEQTTKAVPVAIHQQSSGSDPYHFQEQRH